jgi:hypothetical protein
MRKAIKRIWKKIFSNNISYRKSYEDYNFGCPGLSYRYLQSQPDLVTLKALNHFYMNRELYLNHANTIHNTLGYCKEDIICSINREVEKRDHVKYSSNFIVTDKEDHAWTKAAYACWNPDVTPFSKQFNKCNNSNLYLQEQINTKLEWEKSVLASSDKTIFSYSTVLGMTGHVVQRKELKLAY